MSIRQITPMSEIDTYLESELDNIDRVLVRCAAEAGERGNNQSRMHHTYIDRTGNLTSSMSYSVAKDGNLVLGGDCEEVNKGQAGAKEGEIFAKQLLAEFSDNIAVVQSAGMDYAGYVSAKGNDVLDSGELVAERTLKERLTKAGFIIR